MYKFIKINGIIWLVVTNQRKLIMQNIEFDFDKTKHVMFSKECEREMKNKISSNYQNDLQDKIWKDVQLKYAEFTKQFNLLEIISYYFLWPI